MNQTRTVHGSNGSNAALKLAQEVKKPTESIRGKLTNREQLDQNNSDKYL